MAGQIECTRRLGAARISTSPTAKALATQKPEVTKFLESIDFTPDEITEMSYAVEVDRQPPADYAKAWVGRTADRVQNG